MESIKELLDNTKAITLSDTMQQQLMNFERVLDHLNLYVFKNWMDGELVKGPEVKKYWVTCTFMWPHSKMPDPVGGEKLLNYGCKVLYRVGKIKTPVEITSYEDFQPATKYPKMIKKKIWLVEVTMPQKLITDILRGSLDVEDETIDVSNLDAAIEKDVDDEIYQNQNDNMENDAESGMPVAPPNSPGQQGQF